MKLQIQGQMLRFRINEAGLSRLLAGEALRNITCLGTARVFSQMLALHDAADPTLEAGAECWSLRLPRAAVDDYVARLPCRDALAFELQQAGDVTLSLRFEVDVRDSLQTRGARKRSRHTG